MEYILSFIAGLLVAMGVYVGWGFRKLVGLLLVAIGVLLFMYSYSSFYAAMAIPY